MWSYDKHRKPLKTFPSIITFTCTMYMLCNLYYTYKLEYYIHYNEYNFSTFNDLHITWTNMFHL